MNTLYKGGLEKEKFISSTLALKKHVWKKWTPTTLLRALHCLNPENVSFELCLQSKYFVYNLFVLRFNCG